MKCKWTDYSDKTSFSKSRRKLSCLSCKYSGLKCDLAKPRCSNCKTKDVDCQIECVTINMQTKTNENRRAASVVNMPVTSVPRPISSCELSADGSAYPVVLWNISTFEFLGCNPAAEVLFHKLIKPNQRQFIVDLMSTSDKLTTVAFLTHIRKLANSGNVGSFAIQGTCVISDGRTMVLDVSNTLRRSVARSELRPATELHDEVTINGCTYPRSYTMPLEESKLDTSLKRARSKCVVCIEKSSEEKVQSHEENVSESTTLLTCDSDYQSLVDKFCSQPSSPEYLPRPNLDELIALLD